MDVSEDLVGRLFARDNNAAYAALVELLRLSGESECVYAYMDLLCEMLQDKNSYVRVRGMRLFAANAKWDAEEKVERFLDTYLLCLSDEKPIAARQCAQNLPRIAAAKPHLKEKIAAALLSAELSRYAESMRPLLESDIKNALQELDR